MLHARSIAEFDPLFTISSNNQTNKNQQDGTKTRRTKTTPERVHGYKPRRGRKPRSGKGEFNGTFISRAEAFKDPEISSKVAGKIAGQLKRHSKSTFGDFDWNQDELKGKRSKKRSRLLAAFLVVKSTNCPSQLRRHHQATFKKVKDEYESKLADWQKKYGDLSGLHNNLKQEYETTVNSLQDQRRTTGD